MSPREWIGTVAFGLMMAIAACVVLVSIVALWMIEPVMGAAMTAFALLVLVALWGTA